MKKIRKFKLFYNFMLLHNSVVIKYYIGLDLLQIAGMYFLLRSLIKHLYLMCKQSLRIIIKINITQKTVSLCFCFLPFVICLVGILTIFSCSFY